jgi:hypothetical protein
MHTDHDHRNDAMQFRLLIEPRTVCVLRNTWAEAAAEAVQLGKGKWVDQYRTSIYLRDEASIQRVQKTKAT